MEGKLNIYQRLHSVMQSVDYVQKNEKSGMQYKFVSHDAVTAKVRGPLVTAGVVYHPHNMRVAQNGNRTEVQMDVRFVNKDDPKDYVDVPSFGYGIDSQDKGPGKAISYAVKYALLKALGLETGDDPERDNEEHKPNQVAEALDESRNTDARAAQYDYVNDINGICNLEELEAYWADNGFYVNDELPAEYACLVKDQYENRKQQLKRGDTAPGPYSFLNVAKQDAWMELAENELKRCKSVQELTAWQNENRRTVNALEKKRKAIFVASFQKRMEAAQPEKVLQAG